MKKAAPGWGKAIGIIMICLGSLGTFYQIYKIILPSIFSSFPMGAMNQAVQNSPTYNERDRYVLDQMSGMFEMGGTTGKLLMWFGVLGVAITVFYIIAGAKLLTAKPENYNFAKYALIGFIAYNVIEGILFLTGGTGMFIRLILIYSLIGLVFDLALVIILTQSNKAAYGIGVDTEMESYTLHQDDQEII